MDFEHETPETIAAAIAETIGQDVDYRPVESDGAARAAALIAPLLEEGKPRLRRHSRHLKGAPMHAHHDKPASFHSSPQEAMQAPPEEFLYLACLHEGTGVEAPDFLAVVDAEDGHGSCTRRRCRTSATSCTTSAGTAAARLATAPTART